MRDTGEDTPQPGGLTISRFGRRSMSVVSKALPRETREGGRPEPHIGSWPSATERFERPGSGQVRQEREAEREGGRNFGLSNFIPSNHSVFHKTTFNVKASQEKMPSAGSSPAQPPPRMKTGRKPDENRTKPHRSKPGHRHGGCPAPGEPGKPPRLQLLEKQNEKHPIQNPRPTQ